MEGVLEAGLVIAKDPRRRREATGETITYLLEAGYQPTDIAAFISGLRTRLESLAVMVTPVPPMTAEFSTDEVGFEDLLSSEVRYGRPEQIVVDVESLTAIHRLRKGRSSRRIEDSRALFVTTNMHVVAAARKQFADDYHGGCIPVAIGANDLAAIAWLKQPGTMPDLPAKIILADSYAALCPPDDAAWQSYLKRIRDEEQKGQVTPDDYRILRHDLQVRAVLLHRSLETGETFAEGDVHQVLARAKDNIAAEVRADLDAARVELERRGKEIAETRAREASAQARTKELESITARRQAALVERVSKAVTWSAARVPLLVLATVIVIGAWMVLPVPLGPNLEHWTGAGRIAACGVVAIFTFGGVFGIFGIDAWVGVAALERRLAPRVRSWVEVWISRVLTPSPESPSGNAHDAAGSGEA